MQTNIAGGLYVYICIRIYCVIGGQKMPAKEPEKRKGIVVDGPRQAKQLGMQLVFSFLLLGYR